VVIFTQYWRVAMANSTQFELERTKSRLAYYKLQQEQKPSAIHKKWLEIYQERIRKLERQAQKQQQSH